VPLITPFKMIADPHFDGGSIRVKTQPVNHVGLFDGHVGSIAVRANVRNGSKADARISAD